MAVNIDSNIVVADDTISLISGIAATSVEGISALGEGVTFKALPFIGSKSLKKRVTVVKDENGDNLHITLTVVLKQGAELKQTCIAVQEKVKESIESMLDLHVNEVNVRVAKLDDI